MAIRQITCGEAAAALQAGEIRLLDVRNRWEWDIVSVPGSELLDDAVFAQLQRLPRDTPLAFLCHHGIRSQQAAQHFDAMGFTELCNVIGGVEAWAREIDPSLPRY